MTKQVLALINESASAVRGAIEVVSAASCGSPSAVITPSEAERRLAAVSDNAAFYARLAARDAERAAACGAGTYAEKRATLERLGQHEASLAALASSVRNALIELDEAKGCVDEADS